MKKALYLTITALLIACGGEPGQRPVSVITCVAADMRISECLGQDEYDNVFRHRCSGDRQVGSNYWFEVAACINGELHDNPCESPKEEIERVGSACGVDLLDG